MASEWPTMSLSEAGVLLLDCLHKTPAAMPEGLPYVTIPQMKEGRLDLDAARRISRSDFEEWTQKARPQPFDVVLSRRCNPGETAGVPEGVDFALGQNLVLLRSDGTRIFGPFLQWLVRGRHWWEQVRKFLNVGAVFDSLKCADIPNFLLPVPPISEQRAIAHILGTLDDKIELNRQMNETLEEMARALFRSWFVDFDPVRAKMDGRWLPGESLPGLPAELYELFPDRLVESELGEVPEGWEIRPLDTIADFLNGAACQKFRVRDREPSLPVIKIRELTEGVTESSDRASMDVPEKYVVRNGDVLFSWSGSLLCRIWAGGEGFLNQHVFKVTSQFTPTWFFLNWIWIHLPDFRRIAADKATTMGHIKRGHLTEAQAVVPKNLEAFNSLFEPIFGRWLVNEVEAATLVALRDTLLPKLISGELRVPDAERIAAQAD